MSIWRQSKQARHKTGNKERRNTTARKTEKARIVRSQKHNTVVVKREGRIEISSEGRCFWEKRRNTNKKRGVDDERCRKEKKTEER